MNVNSIEVDFKITRPQDAERFEKALIKMQKKEDGYKKKYKEGRLSLADMWTSMLAMLKDFFIDVTESDILGDINDVEDAYAVYIEFCKQVNAQQHTFLNKYAGWQIDEEVPEE